MAARAAALLLLCRGPAAAAAQVIDDSLACPQMNYHLDLHGLRSGRAALDGEPPPGEAKKEEQPAEEGPQQRLEKMQHDAQEAGDRMSKDKARPETAEKHKEEVGTTEAPPEEPRNLTKEAEIEAKAEADRKHWESVEIVGPTAPVPEPPEWFLKDVEAHPKKYLSQTGFNCTKYPALCEPPFNCANYSEGELMFWSQTGYAPNGKVNYRVHCGKPEQHHYISKCVTGKFDKEAAQEHFDEVESGKFGSYAMAMDASFCFIERLCDTLATYNTTTKDGRRMCDHRVGHWEWRFYGSVYTLAENRIGYGFDEELVGTYDNGYESLAQSRPRVIMTCASGIFHCEAAYCKEKICTNETLVKKYGHLRLMR